MNRPFAVFGGLLLCLSAALGPVPVCGDPGPRTQADPPAFLPSYSHSPLIRHLLHWPHLPVRVFFLPGGTPEQRKAALAGFDEWVKAARGVVGYRVVEKPTDADLTVQFDPQASVPSRPGAVGTTVVEFSGSELKKAVMELATGDAGPDQWQTDAAHEFGHALGIDGHSDNSGDLMYAVTIRLRVLDLVSLPPAPEVLAPPRGVTTRDLNTLKAAYSPLFAPSGEKKPHP